jgi:hypothetical protein
MLRQLFDQLPLLHPSGLRCPASCVFRLSPTGMPDAVVRFFGSSIYVSFRVGKFSHQITGSAAR